MLGRLKDASHSGLAPRAQLEGAIIPAGFKLPSVAAVESDVRTLVDMLSSGQGPVPERAVFVSSNGAKTTCYGPDAGKDDASLPEPLAWNMMFPSLFKFGYFCRPEDVPDDLMDPVIWSLQMFHRVLSECSDEQLYNAGHYLPHQQAEDAGRFMLTNTRLKLCSHLLDPSVDRPLEAIPYLGAAIELNALMLKDGKAKVKGTGKEKRKYKARPWLYNPMLYAMYAKAKVSAGQFDEDTKVALERVIEANEDGESGAIKSSEFAGCLIGVKIDLVQVLKQMGKPEEDYKEHEDWAVTFLRKNPTLISPGALVQLLGRSSQPVHPVLTRLGGDKWLQKQIVAAMVNPRDLAAHLRSTEQSSGKRQTVEEAVKSRTAGTKRATVRQEERVVTQCRQCSAREPAKKLFRCAGCQYIFYCSKECQKANWKLHKTPCRERAAERKRLAALPASPAPTDSAARERDWVRWRDHPSAANSTTLALAMGLHRAPARGRTHIVVRQIAYTPLARDGTPKDDIRDRFEVVAASVFRIADVHGDIETALGLDPGEGRTYIAEMLAELDSLREGDRSDEMVPILDLTLGEGITAWLGSTATTVGMLRTFPYDAEWRTLFNKSGVPAAPLKLVSGAKDAEHHF